MLLWGCYYLQKVKSVQRMLMTGKRQTSHPSWRRARRKIWETTSCLGTLLSLGGLWNKCSWKPFPSTWRARERLGTTNMDLTHHSWPTFLPDLWVRGQQWMLYTLTMSKAFEMVCHSMFIAKSMEHELHSQQISGWYWIGGVASMLQGKAAIKRDLHRMVK